MLKGSNELKVMSNEYLGFTHCSLLIAHCSEGFHEA